MVLERIYTIPLRKEYLKVARFKRAPKAKKALLSFLQKHMKSETVKLGGLLNEAIWEKGIKNPPHHLKVKAIKEDDGTVYAELDGFTYVKKSTKVLPKEQKGKLQEMMEKMGAKPTEKKQSSEEKKATVLEQKTETIKKEKQAASLKEEKVVEKLEETELLAEKKKEHKVGKATRAKKNVSEEERPAGA